MGNMMERVIYNRHLPIVENTNGLSERQYGFRCTHSKVDAISMVSSNNSCVVLKLDVKNAFNSVNLNSSQAETLS